GFGGERALAVGLRPHRRRPDADLQHLVEQLDRAGERRHARAGRDCRAACGAATAVTHAEATPRTSLSVREACAAVLGELRPLESERVPLGAAVGRVLACDVISPLSLPPWDNASMDGYAVRAADVRGARGDAPIALPVTETIAAGGLATSPLAPATAIRIMTGAPVPAG